MGKVWGYSCVRCGEDLRDEGQYNDPNGALCWDCFTERRLERGHLRFSELKEKYHDDTEL